VKKKTRLPEIAGIIGGILLLTLFFVGISMFRGIGGRSYSAVPNYDLLVRDVKAGDVTIRIPAMDSFPEEEYVYMVSYRNRWPGADANGYNIHSRREDERYEVECYLLSDEDTPRQTNMELLGVPMELSLDDDTSDGLWVGQIFIDLDGYRYRVRYENWQGVVADVRPQLEKIAASLLSDSPVPTGM